MSSFSSEEVGYPCTEGIDQTDGPEHNIGKPTARGPIVEGTPEAMQKELTEIIDKLKGSDGDAMRAKAAELGKEIMADVTPGGMAYEMMVKIGKLGD